MDSLYTVLVKYNGQFDNSSNYIGGEERIVYVPINNVTVHTLRSSIQFIFDVESIPGEYNIYYLSVSQTGRHIRSILSTDAELARLFSISQEPIVYIVMQHPIIRRAPQPITEHIPQFQTQSSQFITQSPPYLSQTPPFISEFGGDWFSFGPSTAGRSHNILINLNEPPFDDDENEDEGFVQLDDDEDEASLDGESDDDVEDASFGTSIWNCTLADFNAWIRREGGMNAFLSSLVPTHPLPVGIENQPDEEQEIRNWLLPATTLDLSDSPLLRDTQPHSNDELGIGSVFMTKKDLYIAVALWHMESRTEFKVDRSSTTRLEYSCKRVGTCPFLLRASSRNGCWYVHKFKPQHTCNEDFSRLGGRTVRSLAVAAYFAKKMRRQSMIIRPKDIIVELQQTFGIKASYDVALRARNTAIALIYGGHKESYQMLPNYLEVLSQYNPGTMTDLHVQPDGRFKHFFVALGVCRAAFSAFCRQVIVVDATHLKGRNKGVLFAAVTKDGNEQIFPLAIAVGPIENDESWKWFLSRLRQAYECNPHMLIVSDQHISIGNAIKEVYPETAHGLCYYHLQNKLTSYGAFLVNLYRRAAYAYRNEQHNKFMENIMQHAPNAFDRLMAVGPERWARSQCPVRRYSFMTSNAAEVFNSRILDARRLPICSMIEAFRHIMEQWFDMRRTKAFEREDQLTEEAAKKIAPTVEQSEKFNTVRTGPGKYKVHDGNRSWMVDLEQIMCTCREFQLDLIPCSHAVVAIRFDNLNLYEYIHDYYKTSTLREIYAGTVNPLPPQDEWVISPENQTLRVLPPIISRQAGRPRNSRHPSGAEAASQRRTTPQPSDCEPSSSRSRGPKTCSICRSTAHTKRRCPQRPNMN